MITLPEIIEKTGRNKRGFTIPTKLYEKGIITLMNEVDDDLAYTIITQLLYLDTLDTDEHIKLYINSPGGVVTAGLAIYDTINSMRRKVDTIGMGSCASMGQFLLTCGTGERKALKNARIMMHSVSSGAQGTVHDIKIDFEETQYLQDKLMSIMSGMTKGKLSLDDIEKMTQRDKYLSPEECIKYGLIDSVV